MFSFVRSPKFLYSSVFLLGLTLRGIPELLVPWYPVGYETITYYAPPMFAFGETGLVNVFVEFFRAGPLLYVLLWFVQAMSGAHPYLILKLVGPLLYGGLTVSFLFFLRKGLKLNEKIALTGSLLLIFQVAALRESWDRFRNVLALVFVFAALTAIKSDHRFKWPLVAGLSVLAAISRDYVALVLFIAILGFAVLERKERVMSLVVLAPALSVFGGMVYLTWIWWSSLPSNPYALGNYSWVVQDALSIFAVCYLPLLPFVLKGWFSNNLLDPMLVWLLVGSFSVFVSPLVAVPAYQRWQILLVFPFCIYAIKGFDRFRLFDGGRSRTLGAILLIQLVIGVGYSSGTFSCVVLRNSWVPANLVQSSIAWNQIDDVKAALCWLDEKATTNSAFLVEERFLGWTSIYLSRANNDVTIIDYSANSSPMSALEKALDLDFRGIYLIWYTEFDLDDFRLIRLQDEISIFEYDYLRSS